MNPRLLPAILLFLEAEGEAVPLAGPPTTFYVLVGSNVEPYVLYGNG